MKLIFSSGKQLFFHSPSTQLSYHRSFFNLLLSVGDTTPGGLVSLLPSPLSASAVRDLPPSPSTTDEPPPLSRPLCPPIAKPTVSQRVIGGWKKCFSRQITSFEQFLGRCLEHRSLMTVVQLFIHKVYVGSSKISDQIIFCVQVNESW